jgi:hypothetical protein
MQKAVSWLQHGMNEIFEFNKQSRLFEKVAITCLSTGYDHCAVQADRKERTIPGISPAYRLDGRPFNKYA